MTRQDSRTGSRPSPDRRRAVLLLGAGALAPLLLAGRPAPAQPDPPAATLIGPDELARRLEARTLEAGEVTLVNVHVPYAGEIEGTDAFIPFDRIDPSALPARKDAGIVVYCVSGRMSAIAARQLVALGYTEVSELEGGMNAWVASGRELVTR